MNDYKRDPIEQAVSFFWFAWWVFWGICVGTIWHSGMHGAAVCVVIAGVVLWKVAEDI